MLSAKFKKGQVLCIGFADDGTLLIHCKDLGKMKELMQKALHKVERWANECGLTLSTTKTKAMLFTRKKKVPAIDLDLKLYGESIEFVNEMRCLGIIQDSKLKWNAHISDRIKRAKRYIHQISTSIGRTWGPSPSKMLWLWTAIVRPAIPMLHICGAQG